MLLIVAPLAVEKTLTTLPGPPSTTCVWSGLMSAARTASNSSPNSVMRLPVATSKSTTLPLLASTPPPTSSSLPLRLNLIVWGTPSGNGSTPSGSSVSVLYSSTWCGAPTAASGAHGLAASASNCPARGACTAGSSTSVPGIGGGPSGLPLVVVATFRSTFALVEATAELPAVSSTPPAIHFLIASRSLSGILSPLGGMNGSSVRDTSLNSSDPSG